MKKFVIFLGVIGIASVGFYLFSRAHLAKNPSPARSGNGDSGAAPGDDATARVLPARSPLEQHAETSLLDSFRECLLDPAEESRHARFLELLKLLHATDTRQVLALLEEFRKRGGIDFTFEQRAFWRRRGELDPEQAIADLDNLAKDAHYPAGERRIADAMTELFRGWATSDPQAAGAWLSQNQSHPEIKAAFFGFMDTYARSDPSAATKVVLSMFKPDDPRFNSAMGSVFNAVVETGSTQDAMAWYQGLPTDDAGIKARQSVAPKLAEKLLDMDPSAARAWIEQQAGTPWRSVAAINLVAASYAATDPAAAMNWISGLPPDPNNGSVTGVGKVVQNWAQTDPGSLENWITSQTSSSRLLAQVLGDYATVTAPQDYNKAMTMLNQIPDQYAFVRTNFMPGVQRYAPRPATPH